MTSIGIGDIGAVFTRYRINGNICSFAPLLVRNTTNDSVLRELSELIWPVHTKEPTQKSDSFTNRASAIEMNRFRMFLC